LASSEPSSGSRSIFAPSSSVDVEALSGDKKKGVREFPAEIHGVPFSHSWNISPLKIRIKRGMPICQIIFEEVHGIPDVPYSGQFAIQGPS